MDIKVNGFGEKKILSGYPWVRVDWLKDLPAAESGVTADVLNGAGRFLARGYFEKNSTYPVRLLSFVKEPADAKLFRTKIEKAFSSRKRFLDLSSTDVFRIVNEEGDSLPGLSVDLYGGWALLQYFSRGIERFEDFIIHAVRDSLNPKGIYRLSRMTRSKVYPKEPVRSYPTELVWGGRSPEEFQVRENGINFVVSLLNGAKTGLYLDMRDNRQKFQKYCAGAEVLNAFSFTASFSVYAALAGAKKTVNIDLSKKGNDWGKKNLSLNGIGLDSHLFITDDIFDVLKRLTRRGERFDAVVVDPPTFSKGLKKVFRTEKDYGDLCASIIGLLRKGGILAAALNSQELGEEWFIRTLKSSAAKSGKKLEILEKGGQGPDFPSPNSFPEGRYLKFAIARV